MTAVVQNTQKRSSVESSPNAGASVTSDMAARCDGCSRKEKGKSGKSACEPSIALPVGFEGAEAGLDDAVVVAYIIVDFIRGFFRLSFTPY